MLRWKMPRCNRSLLCRYRQRRVVIEPARCNLDTAHQPRWGYQPYTARAGSARNACVLDGPCRQPVGSAIRSPRLSQQSRFSASSNNFVEVRRLRSDDSTVQATCAGPDLPDGRSSTVTADDRDGCCPKRSSRVRNWEMRRPSGNAIFREQVRVRPASVEDETADHHRRPRFRGASSEQAYGASPAACSRVVGISCVAGLSDALHRWRQLRPSAAGRDTVPSGRQIAHSNASGKLFASDALAGLMQAQLSNSLGQSWPR